MIFKNLVKINYHNSFKLINKMSAFDQPAASAAKQRLVEIPAEEMWTDFLEQINDLMIEEKAARQVGDH